MRVTKLLFCGLFTEEDRIGTAQEDTCTHLHRHNAAKAFWPFHLQAIVHEAAKLMVRHNRKKRMCLVYVLGQTHDQLLFWKESFRCVGKEFSQSCPATCKSAQGLLCLPSTLREEFPTLLNKPALFPDALNVWLVSTETFLRHG